ncbi:MAG TPA: hypothetical protein VKE92_01690, partial [Anaerolineales bacterium]|nr:hypothetical protein [Anaerolineales bacterium]
MDYLDGISSGASSAAAALPVEQDASAARRSVDTQNKMFRNRVQNFWRAALVAVSLLCIQMLECVLPCLLKRPGDPEQGGESRGKRWRDISLAYIHM